MAKKEYEVEKVLAHKKKGGMYYFELKWKGYGLKETTWEPEHHCSHCTDLIKAYWERTQPKEKRSIIRRESSVSNRVKSPPQDERSARRSSPGNSLEDCFISDSLAIEEFPSASSHEEDAPLDSLFHTTKRTIKREIAPTPERREDDSSSDEEDNGSPTSSSSGIENTPVVPSKRKQTAFKSTGNPEEDDELASPKEPLHAAPQDDEQNARNEDISEVVEVEPSEERAPEEPQDLTLAGCSSSIEIAIEGLPAATAPAEPQSLLDLFQAEPEAPIQTHDDDDCEIFEIDTPCASVGSCTPNSSGIEDTPLITTPPISKPDQLEESGTATPKDPSNAPPQDDDQIIYLDDSSDAAEENTCAETPSQPLTLAECISSNSPDIEILPTASTQSTTLADLLHTPQKDGTNDVVTPMWSSTGSSTPSSSLSATENTPVVWGKGSQNGSTLKRILQLGGHVTPPVEPMSASVEDGTNANRSGSGKKSVEKDGRKRKRMDSGDQAAQDTPITTKVKIPRNFAFGTPSAQSSGFSYSKSFFPDDERRKEASLTNEETAGLEQFTDAFKNNTEESKPEEKAETNAAHPDVSIWLRHTSEARWTRKDHQTFCLSMGVENTKCGNRLFGLEVANIMQPLDEKDGAELCQVILKNRDGLFFPVHAHLDLVAENAPLEFASYVSRTIASLVDKCASLGGSSIA